METFRGFTAFYDPPAVVRAAFDEARAIAEIKAAIGRRDEAKGEYQDAIIVVGQKLIEARRAMPGEMLANGAEKYSPAFLAFIEKAGLSKNTTTHYMSFARDPKRLKNHRNKISSWQRDQHYGRRNAILREVLDMLKDCIHIDEARHAIEEELNETK